MNDTSLVAVKIDGSIARITIGSGVRHNALNAAAWLLLAARVRALGGLDAVRVAVIRGQGETFCAGSDMTEWVGAAPDSVDKSFSQMESAFVAVEQCPVPVVAEIRGVAAGAGCQLALACDMRIMAESARIGMPIARLGILSSATFAARLVTLAGPAVARDLLYTGRLLDAHAAVAAGLVNDCVPDADLERATEQTLTRIAGQPPAAIRAAKQAVRAVLEPVRSASAKHHRSAVSYEDFQRGIATFFD